MGFHKTGEKYVRVNYRHYHKWILPQYAVCGILTFGVLFLIVAIVFLAIGSFLTPWGAIMFAIGMVAVLLILFFCLYAYCVFEHRDQETQTMDDVTLNEKQPDFIPTYTVIDKKPPIYPDSSLRNGKTGGGTFPKKQVTIAPSIDRQSDDRSMTIPVQHQSSHPSHATYGYTQPRMQSGFSQSNGHAQPIYTMPISTQQNYTMPRQAQTSYISIQPGYATPKNVQQNYSTQNHVYGYPLQSHEATPYSTLTQRPPQPPSYQSSTRNFTSNEFSEDYDNTRETTPMVDHSHRQQNKLWRPSSSSRDDEPPEPQPLVYPSEKRPMTFEQTSSSKMSIYDNVYALDKLDEE